MSFNEFENDERIENGAAPEDVPAERESETPPEDGGILHMSRPVQPYDAEEGRPAWSEPVYESASGIDSEAYTPGRYAYGVQSVREEPEESGKKKKEKKPHRFLRAACLVIVCALAAGAASWAVMSYMIRNNVGGINNRQVVMGSSLSSAVQDLPDGGSAEQARPGASLTGNQIYDLACQQVVGVNTSFTTNNIFGMSTPSAVSGSGFILSEDGYILTNYHVISYAVVYDGTLTVLLNDGTKYPATVVGFLESNDIAVIKIDASGLKPVALGDSDSMLVGEAVYAVGNPLGELEYSMTDGIVSAQDRMITTRDDITGSQTSINMFQITAAVNAGNSGGPVYNSRGEVIGVVTAKYADEGIEGLGFAIPINDAVSIARQLIENGYVAGAGLGITGMDVTQVWNELAIEHYDIPYGVYVDTVNAGSAAEAAGIRTRDIITGLDGKTVTSMNELKLALHRYSPGETRTITVYRMGDGLSDGETLDLTITFEELVEENTTQQQQQQQQQSGGFTWPFGGFGW